MDNKSYTNKAKWTNKHLTCTSQHLCELSFWRRKVMNHFRNWKKKEMGQAEIIIVIVAITTININIIVIASVALSQLQIAILPVKQQQQQNHGLNEAANIRMAETNFILARIFAGIILIHQILQQIPIPFTVLHSPKSHKLNMKINLWILIFPRFYERDAHQKLQMNNNSQITK